jgi:hypothetical protein
MAGMPRPIETSNDIGGAGQFFRQVEGWLNDPNPQTRHDHRAAARGRVVNNFSGVGTTTLANNPGIQHFNTHWRHLGAGGGSDQRAWWPNITRDRVDQQMGAAFAAALAPENDALNIRLRWDCHEVNLNAGNASFSARCEASGTEVWIDIWSPRAPGTAPDPATNLPNFGFNAISNLPPGFAGPFTPLGDFGVANYDGTAGFDSSFNNDQGAITENNGFRESWSFFPINDEIDNASQQLVGLSYTRDSWRRVGEDEDFTFEEKPLHSETGYLLWDEEHRQAYRIIAMPRGVTVLAVAQDIGAETAELHFDTEAVGNDPVGGGIQSNPFLTEAARTTRFRSTLTIADRGKAFTYDDVADQERADSDPVRHTDSNTLVRV